MFIFSNSQGQKNLYLRIFKYLSCQVKDIYQKSPLSAFLFKMCFPYKVYLYYIQQFSLEIVKDSEQTQIPEI